MERVRSLPNQKCLVPGLITIEDFIDEYEERRILDIVETHDWGYVMGFKHTPIEGPKVCYYGYGAEPDGMSSYGHKFNEQRYISDWVEDLIYRIGFISNEYYNSIQVMQYTNNAGLRSHIDARHHFGKTIAGLSIGSSCVMTFRSGANPYSIGLISDGETRDVMLRRRSLHIMTGPSRYKWSHEIQHTSAIRYSLTFRNVLPDFRGKQLTE